MQLITLIALYLTRCTTNVIVHVCFQEELHPAKVASLQCDICEEVVKIVEQYAEDNETEVCVCVYVCMCFRVCALSALACNCIFT